MKTIEDINLYTWFADRELSYIPDHFTRTTTQITAESKDWVLEKLVGRFAFDFNTDSFFNGGLNPAFEDPKEAMFYELTWG